MAFNGSGVFTRLYNWANDAAASIKIRADRFDAELDGFATGLSTCMTKDGQQLPTAAQNFNGQNLTNVGAFGSTGTNTFSGTTTLFSGTATRIQGDFSNATPANRTAFQDKTTNNATDMYVLPNGTSNQAGIYAWANSDPSNASFVGIGMAGGTARIQSGASGSGTNLPLGFVVAGAEAARFDSGRFMVGTTNNAVVGGSGAWVAIKNSTIGSYALAVDAVNQSGSYYLINFGAAGTQTGSISSS